MWIDFHAHCLPNMDDGAKDETISIDMLQSLRSQGVEKVVATPHFFAQYEGVEAFCSRRMDAHNVIAGTAAALTLPQIILGAEIRLIPNISSIDITPLAIGQSQYALLELPDHPYQRWVGREVREIVEKWGIFPIFAHLERYLSRYSDRDYADILSIPSCICQLSVGALTRSPAVRFAKRLIGLGHTVLLGSDCHNITTRPPNFFLIPQLSYKRNTQDLMRIFEEHTLLCERTMGLAEFKGIDFFEYS